MKTFLLGAYQLSPQLLLDLRCLTIFRERTRAFREMSEALVCQQGAGTPGDQQPALPLRVGQT